MRRTAFFEPALPRLVAHRGLAQGGVVENTLPAFAAALAAGATHLETDVHASRDGVAIVAHDADLMRVAGIPGEVHAFTAAELAALDLGGVGLPTLAEALAAFPEARFNIDIKALEAAESAARAIRDAGAEQRVLVTSFSRRRRRSALRRLATAATSPSAVQLVALVLGARIGWRGLVRALSRSVDALQGPLTVLGVPLAHPTVVRTLHAAGLELHLWTIDDPEVMRALLDAGVDAVITNRVDLLRTVVADRAL